MDGSGPGRPARNRNIDSAIGAARRRASSTVSATTTLTPSETRGPARNGPGSKCSRYSASAGRVLPALKWWAKEKGRPSTPASWALKPLDPSNHTSGRNPWAGVAVIRWYGCSSGKEPSKKASTSPSCWGKSSAPGAPPRTLEPDGRRSAWAVSGSVPGARPMPRSMRPGCSASSMPNCSATTSGAWFGSITPPEPTRIVEVAWARWPMSTAGAELAMPGMLWCSATQ